MMAIFLPPYFFIFALLIWEVVLYSPLLGVLATAIVVTLATCDISDHVPMLETYWAQNSVLFISQEPLNQFHKPLLKYMFLTTHKQIGF